MAIPQVTPIAQTIKFGLRPPANEGPRGATFKLVFTGEGSFDLNLLPQQCFMSSIQSVYVDNRQSNVETLVSFADGEEIAVAPFGVGFFPVCTGLLSATVSNTSSSGIPVTVRFFNVIVPPIANQGPQAFYSHTALVGLTLVTSNTTIVASGINGLIQTISIDGVIGSSGLVLAKVIQGDQTVLTGGAMVGGVGVIPSSLVRLTGIALPFTGGLVLDTSVAGTPSGFISVTCIYQPVL